MMRFAILLTIFAVFTGSASAQHTAPPETPLRVGANATTLEYVRSTIDHFSGDAANATYKTLADGDIYRQFQAGRLDLASVFGRPEQLGVNDFAKTFATPPAELVVGHAACMVIVPAARKIDRLTVAQLADVVSGKIAMWDQLGAGAGAIEVRADPTALAALRLHANFQPMKELMREDRHDSGNGVYSSLYFRIVARQQPATDKNSALPDILGLTSSPSVIGNVADPNSKSIALTPIAGDQNLPASTPTLENIRDGAYALSATWRLLVHPNAPPRAAGYAKLCLRSYESGLVNADYVKEWLFQPRRQELGNVVRVYVFGRVQRWWWRQAMEPLLNAYAKSHPDAAVKSVDGRVQCLEELLEHNVDVLQSSGRFWPDDREKLERFYGKNIPEKVIGYQPLLVLVHPSCPVKRMTLEQVRRITENDVTSWSQIGWVGQSASVVKRARDSLAMQDSLFDRRMKSSAVTGNYKTDAEMLRAAKDDPHGLTFLLASEAALASGLRALEIGESADAAVPPTAENVASGRYPARYPMTVLLHPDAGKPSQRFLEWLRGPEAGAILAVRHIYTPAYAASRQPEKKAAAAPTVETIPKNISGGAAVFPTECRSLYFLMAGEAELAAYDGAIADALAADGRLRMVNRDHIQKVLEEWNIARRTGRPTSNVTFIAADVFVLPSIVTEGAKSFVRVQAYHGATASLLSEARWPIDPAAPTRFEPPLEKAVADWWPSVLKRLAAVRSLPVWSVVAVYPGKNADEAAAERVAEQLGKRLAAQGKLFLADYVPLDAARQEVLLTFLWKGRSIGGRFTPAAEVLVEGRILDDGALEIRLRSGKSLDILTLRRFGGTSEETIVAAAAWCRTQAGEPAVETSDPNLQDWAVEQARHNICRYRQLMADYKALEAEARARAAANGQRELSPHDAERLAVIENSCSRCAARAVQLDPANEDGYTFPRFTGSSSFSDCLQHAVAGEQFCERFPHSKRWRDVIVSTINVWNYCATSMSDEFRITSETLKIPAGIDHAKAARVCLEHCVHCLDLYALRLIVDPKRNRNDWWSNSGVINLYQDRLAKHLVAVKASPEEIQRAVDRWAEQFDRRPEFGAPSDMLRLRVLAMQRNREGFLDTLTALQRAHPDPKEAFWTGSKSWIPDRITTLFPGAFGRDGFTAWMDGRQGSGGLPYEGYKAGTDR